MKTIKLKNEHAGNRIRANGITYDFSNMSQERMMRIWESTPAIRQYFDIEEQEVIQIDESTFFTAEEFDQIVKEAAETQAYLEDKKTKKKK